MEQIEQYLFQVMTECILKSIVRSNVMADIIPPNNDAHVQYKHDVP